jgi:hypothetical protein
MLLAILLSFSYPWHLIDPMPPESHVEDIIKEDVPVHARCIPSNDDCEEP